MKKGSLALLIVGACLLVGGIIGIIVGLILEQTDASIGIYVISGTSAFAGLIITLSAFAHNNIKKAAEKNLSDPTSIAYRTYGGHGDYQLIRGYLNKAAGTARNAAINAAGVVGVLFGFGGVFVTGQNVLDIFVSDADLVINDKRKNGRMANGGFFEYPAQTIANLSTEITKKNVSIHLDFNSGCKSFTLDIPVKSQEEIDSVVDAFVRLRSPAPETVDNSFIPLFE